MITLEELKHRTDVPVILADHEGRITYVNGPFQKVFGWNAEGILGQSLIVIIPTNLHDAHHLGFSRFLTTGKPTLLNQPLKLKAVTKDGRELEAEHLIVAEFQEGRWMFGATLRPL